MTVRGCETADRRTVEHREFGGFPEVGDLEAERQLADVVGAVAGRRYGIGARVALFDLDPFDALFVHEATLPVAFER